MGRRGADAAEAFQLPPSHEGERTMWIGGLNVNNISTPALA